MTIAPDVSSSDSGGMADEAEELMDPDDLPLHSQPNLVMLAIMLIELYMGKPIYELVQSSNFAVSPIQTIDENSRYRLATEAFQRCGPEFTDNYRLAIATCLDLDFGLDADDNELQAGEFKDLVYREIVQCLEDELDQGFGKSMPIDNLDEAAPTLNLNMWGTMDITPPEDAAMPLSMESRAAECVLTMRSCQTTSIEWGERGSQCAILAGRGIVERDINNSVTHLSLTHQDYIVGWICALPEEMAAARAMLDKEHPILPQDLRVDNNNYVLGRIGSHNIVIACLPSGVTGTTSAAVVANRMRSTFRGLRFGLMVGIGGAAPSETDDIRLGDVVVGTPHGGHSGVVQYDFGKTIEEGRLMITSALNRAPNILLTAVSNLKSQHFLWGHQIQLNLQKMIEQYPRLKEGKFSHPGAGNDLLYQSDYSHAKMKRTCASCDPTKTITRKVRDSTEPVIHYGLIASGNQVMKDAITRDRLKHDLDILCFEMEAAGLVDDFPCLVIRGISDYADSHKNDMWRNYAAATAAAYAKELLNSIPADRVAEESPRT
jgi:nucleoside phosphorylase